MLLGVAYLVLLGHIAFLFRAALLALILAALTIPALAALALVSAVCSLVVAYEAIRHREARVRLRHHGPGGLINSQSAARRHTPRR